MKIKLYKKWVIVGVILSLLIGASVAYGVGYVTKPIDGIGVSGEVIIIGPAPTADDIVIQSMPTFTVTFGDTTKQRGDMVVLNNSAYDLTFILDEFVLKFDDPKLGLVYQYAAPEWNAVMASGKTQTITIEYAPSGTVGIGTYRYSGNITYSYEE